MDIGDCYVGQNVRIRVAFRKSDLHKVGEIVHVFDRGDNTGRAVAVEPIEGRAHTLEAHTCMPCRELEPCE